MGVIGVVRFLIRTALSAAGVLLVAYLGLITVDGFVSGQPVTWAAFLTAALFAIVLGIVNGVVKPIVQVLTIPITVLTLGLFALVINLAMFYLAAGIIPGVAADQGFFQTALAAIIVSIVAGVASSLTSRED
jgi:putative membrane protein